jgi:hypothetical protein
VGVYYYSKEKSFKPNSMYAEKLDTNGQKNDQEKKLTEVVFNNDDVNFAEEDLHLFKYHDYLSKLNIRIKYDGENLIIYKDDYRPTANKTHSSIETEEHTLRVPLKLAQLLNLDMGRAFVGFVQESTNGNFFIDVLSWKMVI